MSSWSRLVRFVPKGSSSPLIGEPVDAEVDVGLAVYSGKDVEVEVYSGSSVLDAGSKTGDKQTIERVLSPLTMNEVGTIRCIGLNYMTHAKEAKLQLPKVPITFLKPATALADPFPAPTVIPKFTLEDDTADYESELTVVIGKDCKDVSEADALDYVLGYTAGNDISSRKTQFEQSQWCYSKGFDGACPIGPVIVSSKAFPDPSKFKLRGIQNGNLRQQSGLDDLIFNVPKIISFLSQGTTLPAGTTILTGTPSGVGIFADPKTTLKDGDEFKVEILPGIGTLVNKMEYQK